MSNLDEARGFLNVPGNQFLIDFMWLMFPLSIIPFIAFVILLIVWPGVFDGFYNVPGSLERSIPSFVRQLWNEPLVASVLQATNGLNSLHGLND
ncbi:unnamed protein product [Allacma fusca]|uniref:Uncharacterized protein n=1 Tax=Allacma fusca TaxID=39272 RepID=A0A8J2LL71_9HEXA|nr:unnamed protein product [Allacma fusca]